MHAYAQGLLTSAHVNAEHLQSRASEEQLNLGRKNTSVAAVLKVLETREQLKFQSERAQRASFKADIARSKKALKDSPGQQFAPRVQSSSFRSEISGSFLSSQDDLQA